MTAQVLSAWSCFFTDGTYRDWKNVGDGDLDFGLLSRKNDDLVSDCVLSLIDCSKSLPCRPPRANRSAISTESADDRLGSEGTHWREG